MFGRILALVRPNIFVRVILQKRALRLIYFATSREHAVPLFIASNVLPVNMLYRTVSTLMHDVKNNMAPPNILNLFTSVRSVHTYHTRAATSDKFHCKYSRLKQQTDSFSRVGVKIWNEIPVDLWELTKSSFKAKINNMLSGLGKWGYLCRCPNFNKNN